MIDLITSGSLSYPISNEREGEANSRSYKVSDDSKNLITY